MVRTASIANISRYLVQFSSMVSMSNAAGKTDINKDAENIAINLLNKIFGYSLENANNILKANFPAVDLVDSSNRIAIQVTSTADRKKVRYTLNKFVENKLNKDYDRLIIYFINDRNVSLDKDFVDEISNIINGSILFNPKKDIINNLHLYTIINNIVNIDQLLQIETLLAKEIGFTKSDTPDTLYGHAVPKRLNAYADYSADELVGREQLLEEIHGFLNDRSLLILNGLGGIGKTTVARAYLKQYEDKYNHVAYMEITTNFSSAFIKQLSPIVADFKYDSHLDEADNTRILVQSLRLIPNTLLVIDNFDNEEELRYSQAILESLRWNIIITSRAQPNNLLKNIIKVNALNPEEALLLFTNHYTISGEEDLAIIKDIIAKSYYHTKLIILLAKAASINPLLELKTLSDTISENAYQEESIDVNVNLNEEERSVYEFILMLFKPENLDGYQRYYIRFFSILPSIEIPINHLYELFENESNQKDFINTIKKLVDKGWIEKYGANYYRIHPLIQLVTIRKMKPTYYQCRKLITNILYKLDTPFNMLSLAIYLPYCESIASYFKEDKIYDIALLYNKMSVIYKTLAEYDKAISANISALKILNSLEEKYPEAIAQSYGYLMTGYAAVGKYEIAIENGIECLNIQEGCLHSYHSDLGATYNNLASVLRKHNQHKLAFDYINKALHIFRWIYFNNFNTRGAFNLINTYTTLGSIIADFGRWENDYVKLRRALFIEHRSLVVAKRILPNYHHKFADIFNNISLTYRDLGEPEKAMNFLEKSIKIKKESLPENHPDLALSYYNMSILFEQLKRLKEALYFAELAYDIQINKLSPDHDSVTATRRLLERLT